MRHDSSARCILSGRNLRWQDVIKTDVKFQMRGLVIPKPRLCPECGGSFIGISRWCSEKCRCVNAVQRAEERKQWAEERRKAKAKEKEEKELRRKLAEEMRNAPIVFPCTCPVCGRGCFDLYGGACSATCREAKRQRST